MRNFLFCFLIFFIFSNLFSDQLPVSVDMNRFLDDSSDTIFEINYELPYNTLSFKKTASGFKSGLKVEYSFSQDSTIVDEGDFVNTLIFPNQEMSRSAKLFRDKFSVTLPRSIYTLQITFTDINSLSTSDWSGEMIILPRNSFLSDLEFSSGIVADTTNYLEKFHRADLLFFVNSTHIFTKGTLDTLFLYYELGNKSYPVGTLNEKIDIVRASDTIQVVTNPRNCNGLKVPIIQKVDISKFEEGYYKIYLEATDPISDMVCRKEDYFSIKKKNIGNYRLFVDIEDEITLLKYFLPSNKIKIWKELSYEGKLRFIDRFWQTNDTDTITNRNEYYELIKKRIEYSNKNFSHFTDGWHTDRGRVYIKHGKPDDILSGDTEIKTKYAQKKYEIWKYRTYDNYTYLFLDFQTNQNYQLIYSENDPNESSSSKLESYLGEDFDMSLLD